jgi:hypothetical protein
MSVSDWEWEYDNEHEQLMVQEESKDPAKEDKVEAKCSIKTFIDTQKFVLMVCSFLPGSDLFHKIAVLNKQLRNVLP